MSDATVVERIRFEVDDPEYVEAGVDYREGTLLFDSGVTGRVHLFLDGTELTAENRLPATFELSDTVSALYEMVREFETEGRVRTLPFCCACGDRGCAYVRWELEAVDPGIRLTMEDLLERPIGDHHYRIRRAPLYVAIAELAETVATTLREAGADDTTAGTVREFERWRRELTSRT